MHGIRGQLPTKFTRIRCEAYVLAIVEQMSRSDILSETCKAKLGAKNVEEHTAVKLSNALETNRTQNSAPYGFAGCFVQRFQVKQTVCSLIGKGHHELSTELCSRSRGLEKRCFCESLRFRRDCYLHASSLLHASGSTSKSVASEHQNLHSLGLPPLLHDNVFHGTTDVRPGTLIAEYAVWS